MESPNPVSKKNPDRSDFDGSSLLDKEVDGLLNWAQNLPAEDAFKTSGSSFFAKLANNI